MGKEHRVYAVVVGKGKWRRRLARLEGDGLFLDRPNGTVECAAKRGVEGVTVEPAETAEVPGKNELARKLLDKLEQKKQDVGDILQCMVALTWAVEEVTVLVSFESKKARDSWLRKIADVVAPVASLRQEVTALASDLRQAQSDCERASNATYRSPLRSPKSSPSGTAVFDPSYVRHGNGTSSSPLKQHYPSYPHAAFPPPSFSHSPARAASHVPPFQPYPQHSGRPLTTPSAQAHTRVLTPGYSKCANSRYGDRPSSPYPALFTPRQPGSPVEARRLTNVDNYEMLARLKELETTAEHGIARLQELQNRFSDVVTDAASWRLQKRLASHETCAAALQQMAMGV
ncbi:hypothetical protein DIPPA_19728 [Diplonema papillatum]|nr:hypothetical protein DIPPA_19728 [Diplonema papillatum]